MKFLSTRTLVAMLASAILVAGASLAMAQEKVSKDQAPAAAKARSDFMKDNSAQGKIISAVAKGQAPLDAKAVSAAEKLDKNADELLSHFPAGSGDDVIAKDRAKAVIWKEWDKFTAKKDDFKKAAGELVVAAKSGDQKAFAAKAEAVDKACGACHKAYRNDPPKK
jgi:cytochrome c556